MLTLAMIALSFAPTYAEDVWRFLQVDNVEIISNRSEKQLKDLHREIYYFNRSMELLFGGNYVRTEDPLIGLVVKSEKEMANFSGEENHIISKSLRRFGFEQFVTWHRDAPFHSITHRNLNKQNPPFWYKEGIASLFQSTDVRGNIVRIGKPHDHYVDYQRQAQKPFKVDFADIFGHHDAETINDPIRSIYLRSTAWLFAHYCWFGKHELREKHVALAAFPVITEDIFKQVFGFGFRQLEANLQNYVERMNYRPIEIPIKRLGPLPAANIQIAREAKWTGFHARAYYHSDQIERARELAQAVPAEDPDRLMAAETLWGISRVDKNYDDEARYREEALRLGSVNPHMQMLVVDRQMKDFREAQKEITPEGELPVLPPELASEMLTGLVPALKLHRTHSHAVFLAIHIFDLARAEAPPQIMHIFDIWEPHFKRVSKETDDALQRIRERQAASAVPDRA